MGSGYFTAETEFPFAEVPVQDLRNPEENGSYESFPGHSFEKDILTACLPQPEMDALMLLPACHMICLAGVSGAGKRTLALSYAGTAMRTAGRKLLYVRGKDLGSEEAPSGIRKSMQKLFQKASAQPCVLILETNALETVWENAAECCAALPSDLPLTVFLIEDDPTLIREEWTRHLLLLFIPLPDQQDREDFFALGSNALMRRMDSFGNRVPTFRELADETEGLSYPELKQVVQIIRFRMKLRAIREHHGDPGRIREEYVNNRFYYDIRMFRDAVQKVRAAKEARTVKNEPSLMPAVLPSVPSVRDPFDLILTPPERRTDDEKLTEDEKAVKGVESRLKIPPNPNA